MIVCRQCLQAIESHEGHQIQRKLSQLEDGELIKDGYGDDDGEYVYCEWCEEYVPIDEVYEI